MLFLTSQTLRVVATQASVTLSHFFTDQLESEMKTEERVKKGEISADDADKFNDDWEDVSVVYFLCCSQESQ
jgi:hypothetical protein